MTKKKAPLSLVQGPGVRKNIVGYRVIDHRYSLMSCLRHIRLKQDSLFTLPNMYTVKNVCNILNLCKVFKNFFSF